MPIEIQLIAPCGMNCGTCMAYLREKNRCPGCREAHISKFISISRCKIKNCVVFQGKSEFCFECEVYPCKRLKQLDKRYTTKYNMSMLGNLESIKNIGIKAFVENENKRWHCSKCGGVICVHRGYCINCGNKA